MGKGNGVPVHIEYPLEDDASCAIVAQNAAISRISVRSIFPNREGYLEAFSTLRPDQAIAAFSGKLMVGVVLIKRDRREPFVISRAEFARIWGVIRGTRLWVHYHGMQFLLDTSGTYCCSVWVHPDWRNEGIGGRLYQRLIENTDGEIHALARKSAVAFHRSAGFRRHNSPYRRLIGWIANAEPMVVPAKKAGRPHGR
jgi:GNAT superfamily N-acetyltransferase